EANLGRQIAYEQKRDAPAFFFIDVQPDQRDGFSRLVSGAAGGQPPALIPVVRARLAAIDGVPITRELIDRRKRESPDKIWFLIREYMLTWAAAAAEMQNRVVGAFPNVTAIPVRGVLERVGRVLNQISFAVRFMALFSIAAGLVVMTGALAATRYQRLYESVIFRTLGATRWAIA